MTIEKDKRKKELKDKIGSLSKTVREINPRNRQEALAAMDRILYIANINALKKFLIDRNCEGEKPRLMVESPYTDPETGITEDRIYMPSASEYHQETLDMLKKQQLVPDDSKINDYDFLFV